MATLDEFIAQKTIEVENEKPLTANVNGVERELTDEEYTDLINDRATHAFNEQEYGWYSKRIFNYKPLDKQLEMIYDDQIHGTTTWKDHITQIKTDFPKVSEIPEETPDVVDVLEDQVVEEIPAVIDEDVESEDNS
tara:strand:+ start:622 stop:1029 length:408 start_codon:yes stop_codon:yes gene_type:complete